MTGCLVMKTFGYDKHSDVISISQLVEGTGMSQPSVIKGVRQAEQRGTIYHFKFGEPGTEIRLIMMKTQKNRRLLAQWMQQKITDWEFLLMAGVPLNEIKGSDKLGKTVNTAHKNRDNTPKPNLPVNQIETQDLPPDLTLSYTDNSLSLSSSKSKAPGSPPRTRVPKPTEPVKPVERERENFLKKKEEGENPPASPSKSQAEVRPDSEPKPLTASGFQSLGELMPQSRTVSAAIGVEKTPPVPQPPQSPALKPDEKLAQKRDEQMRRLVAHCLEHGLDIADEQQDLARELLASGVVRRGGMSEQGTQMPEVGTQQPEQGTDLPETGHSTTQMTAPTPPKPAVPPMPTRQDLQAMAKGQSSIRSELLLARVQALQAEWTPEQREARAQLDAQIELQREAKAREKLANSSPATAIGEATRSAQERERKATESARATELDQLLALETPEERVKTLYNRYLLPNNPKPQTDQTRVNAFTTWISDKGREVWEATLDAAHAAHAAGKYSIAWVEGNLQRQGFTREQAVSYA